MAKKEVETYEGSLCKRGHRYNDTNFSLRRRKDNTCIECNKERAKKDREKHKQLISELGLGDQFWGAPCRITSEHIKDGKTLRYSKNRNCVACASIKNKGGSLPKAKTWNTVNPVKMAYYEAERRARTQKALVKEFGESNLIRHFRKVFNLCCFYCGDRLYWEKIEWLYKIPIDNGGVYSLENLVPSCERCSTDKKDQQI